MSELPTADKLKAAARIISSFIHRTPVLSSAGLNAIAETELYFKCENFQKTGSFKARGAVNAVLSLSQDELKSGVVTHSSGNFAQALAYAAARTGASAKIVMPENVMPQKRDAVIAYGAEIIYSGNTPADREKKCEEVLQQNGGNFIHPSNDIRVITGHASCAMELAGEVREPDHVFCPVGGGGLISGIALGFRHFSPKTTIIGAEPKNADDAYRSLKEGRILPSVNPDTIADGLRTSLGDVTFPVIQKLVSEIVTVTEEEIVSAMKLLWERMKIVVEPSGAVAFAAALKQKDKLRGKKTGVIVSGGNVDLKNFNLIVSSKKN